jgi:hypothetical protein
MDCKICLIIREREIWFRNKPSILKNTFWTYFKLLHEPETRRTTYHEKIRRFFERMVGRYGEDKVLP